MLSLLDKVVLSYVVLAGGACVVAAAVGVSFFPWGLVVFSPAPVLALLSIWRS